MALAHAADQRCRAGAASQRFQPILPRAVQSLRETGQLSIVTIGSSTTAGAGASAEDKSYPAMLQDELRRRLPQAEIRVINRGVGGQSAFDMVSRMDTDVIDKAHKILKKGIRKVQAAGIDLVMMDLPWLPREGRYPHYDDYRGVLKTVAAEFSVPVFPRYGMMREWAQSRRFTSEELIGMDGTELVEAGYRCLAIRIADGVAAALSGPRVERPAAPRPTN
ncbi:MAG: hypothetical protein B7Z14_13160 [Bosea sp. 32-68-6]|nr:MAG: hypothetical protein B7Z14_13160 [Bosea sp. 32-68-6]